jgi:hypothetical protein
MFGMIQNLHAVHAVKKAPWYEPPGLAQISIKRSSLYRSDKREDWNIDPEVLN